MFIAEFAKMAWTLWSKSSSSWSCLADIGKTCVETTGWRLRAFFFGGGADVDIQLLPSRMLKLIVAVVLIWLLLGYGVPHRWHVMARVDSIFLYLVVWNLSHSWVIHRSWVFTRIMGIFGRLLGFLLRRRLTWLVGFCRFLFNGLLELQELRLELLGKSWLHLFLVVIFCFFDFFYLLLIRLLFGWHVVGYTTTKNSSQNYTKLFSHERLPTSDVIPCRWRWGNVPAVLRIKSNVTIKPHAVDWMADAKVVRPQWKPSVNNILGT